MGTRIRGESVEVRIIRAGNVEQSLTCVTSFDCEDMLEIIQQGYLGETSDRFDDVYKGSGGNISFDVHDPGWFTLRDLLIDRARRRIPLFKINVLATYSFPDGATKRITHMDCAFGTPGLGHSDRSSYVKGKLSWKCSLTKTK